MFVKKPDPFLLPSYRISPFQTQSLRLFEEVSESISIIDYFNQRFGENNWLITQNGREAIEIALRQFNLAQTELVSILTTSNNFYISSCVTNTISKYCSWNREISEQTKIIFVNHEFGYPFEDMNNLVSLKIPIIEDCCTTFFSQDKSNKIGNYGNYSIYSFPKFFPIQIGGLLVGKNVSELKSLVSKTEKDLIIKILSNCHKSFNEIISKRERVYKLLCSKFANFGFSPRFEMNDRIVPSVFLFNTNDSTISLEKLKVHFTNHGIQCSVFYGENAFFVPVHQNLNDTDINYFYFVLNSFFEC